MSAPAFELPLALEAREPPEARGLARDEVRLMVATRSSGRIVHARFRGLPAFLTPGDLLVVNTSATLPAAVPARRESGEPVRVHFATPAPHRPEGPWWLIELRSPDGASPHRGTRTGERLDLAGEGRAEVAAPYLASERPRAEGAERAKITAPQLPGAGVRGFAPRLWLARIDAGGSVPDYLAHHGEPIRYRYVTGHWPLEAYQTVYAHRPGSAEMASAGRPFTAELLARLVAGGVQVAPVSLHAGVSSPERHEAPLPERYEVPLATARLVNAVRREGGRVVAVGTTVVRALETVATPGGVAEAGAGWTSLTVTPSRGLRLVDGLLTGWHEPEASHLLMLRAAAGERLLRASYDAALAHGYLWHEFGDSHLVLP